MIERVLALLPEEHRKNVIYIDERGRVYSNRPDLKVQFARPLGGGLYAWPDGQIFVDPGEDFRPAAGPSPSPAPSPGWVPPPCSVEVGAFRRVLSARGSGPWWGPTRYAAFSAHIWLPDRALNQIRIADPRNKDRVHPHGRLG